MPQMSRFVPVEVRRAKLHLVDLVRSSDGGQFFLVRVESWEIRKIIVGETTSNIFAKCKVLWGKQLGKYRCCDDASHFGPFRQTSSQQCWQWLWNAMPQTLWGRQWAHLKIWGQAPQTLLTKHQTSCQRQPILSLRWKVTFKKKLAISTCLCRAPRIILDILDYCCVIVLCCILVCRCWDAEPIQPVERNLLHICQGTTWNKSLWPCTSEVQELEVMCPTGRSGINAHLPTCHLSLSRQFPWKIQM